MCGKTACIYRQAETFLYNRNSFDSKIWQQCIGNAAKRTKTSV